MAASGSQTIQLYYSTTSGTAPVAGNLASGEIALNITDGKLYYKDNNGTVQLLSSKGTGTIGGANTQVQYNNNGVLAGSGNLTFDGTTLTAAGLAGPHNGTVGATTPNTGAFTTLSASSTVSGTGFSTYLASPPAIGSTAANTGAFTTLSASGAVTLSGGTANGVAYLNGSKVLTTGSALTFNGSDMAIGGTNTNSARLALVDNSSNNYSSALDFRQTYASTVYSRVYANFGGTLALSADVGNAASGTSDIEFYLSGSEKMRLTSTGLGIGTSSPADKLHISGGQAIIQNTTSSSYLDIKSTGGDFYVGMDNSAGSAFGTAAYAAMFVRTGAYPFYWRQNGSNTMVLDSSGNLGLGVTPSAHGSSTVALQFPSYGVVAGGAGYNALSTGYNFYYNAGYKRIASGYATMYQSGGSTGIHTWHVAASGAADSAISFTQAMTLDASGNLLVGKTASSFSNAGRVSLEINGSTDSLFSMQYAGANSAYLQLTSSDWRFWNTGNTPMLFATNGSERARIDSSGNLLVGATATGVTNVNSVNNEAASGRIIVNHLNGTASGSNYIVFGYNTSNIGSITQNGTTGVLYNLTSDYRLKNNPVPLTGSGEFIDALQPKTWDWWDGSGKGVGFIAHEFMEVAKYSGNGEKDAVDADGKPVYQSIQPSSSEVMANLVAEIQSLRARVAQLEGK